MKLQPLDKVAIPLMLVLTLLIGLLVLSGDHATARVREFSWQNKDIGAVDRAFILNFSRPMDDASVEANLHIEPPLPGKFSWAGRRMAYTLNAPPPYGTEFTLTLQGGVDRLAAKRRKAKPMDAFTAKFQSRDRSFVYIGATDQQLGRLVLNNLTARTQEVLTPDHLLVTNFQVFPNADRILFSAIERTGDATKQLDQQLYTVTTGLNFQAPPELGEMPSKFPLSWLWQRPETTDSPAKVISPLLEASAYQDYQIQRFDLSSDGNTLVIKRIAKGSEARSAPSVWAVALDKKGAVIDEPVLLKDKAGGDFSITPDGAAIAINEGQGLAIVPIKADAKALDFLPTFAQLLSFSKDGTRALTVKFNTDYTRSLFLVNNQGTQLELLKILGSIISADFHPSLPYIYCVLSKVVPGKTYQEQPFLAVINLETKETMPLLALPQQPDITMSLAPDGLALLLDQITLQKTGEKDNPLRTSSGQAISTGQLWLLPIANKLEDQKAIPPEKLPLEGIHPVWMP